MSINMFPSHDRVTKSFRGNDQRVVVDKSNPKDGTSLIKPDGTVAAVGQNTDKFSINPESIHKVAAKVLDQNSSFWEKLQARVNSFKTRTIIAALWAQRVLKRHSLGAQEHTRVQPNPHPSPSRGNTIRKSRVKDLNKSSQKGVPKPITDYKKLACLQELGIATVCRDYQEEKGGLIPTRKLRFGFKDETRTTESVQNLAVELGGEQKTGQDGQHYILIETGKVRRLAELSQEKREAAMAANVEKKNVETSAPLIPETGQTSKAANVENAEVPTSAPLAPVVAHVPKVASVKAVLSKVWIPSFFKDLLERISHLRP